ncbi:hypothetical protein P280DRAFT_101246 [Massarina eburnea CBS 473.64]|uniref:Uncharacterized protein n=1 Tax=Massarina eburnea CBS 473.64 TaxID=1395130 RepID=A0A6A6RQK4_9PLEO|nr:hypothetical protein P280DRAFT_101246 [Massarina eburnea CBS 473.64]
MGLSYNGVVGCLSSYERHEQRNDMTILRASQLASFVLFASRPSEPRLITSSLVHFLYPQRVQTARNFEQLYLRSSGSHFAHPLDPYITTISLSRQRGSSIIIPRSIGYWDFVAIALQPPMTMCDGIFDGDSALASLQQTIPRVGGESPRGPHHRQQRGDGKLVKRIYPCGEPFN